MSPFIAQALVVSEIICRPSTEFPDPGGCVDRGFFWSFGAGILLTYIRYKPLPLADEITRILSGPDPDEPFAQQLLASVSNACRGGTDNLVTGAGDDE
jgi:hypothetical protein